VAGDETCGVIAAKLRNRRSTKGHDRVTRVRVWQSHPQLLQPALTIYFVRLRAEEWRSNEPGPLHSDEPITITVFKGDLLAWAVPGELWIQNCGQLCDPTCLDRLSSYLRERGIEVTF